MNEILLAYIFNELMQSQTSLYRKSNNLYIYSNIIPSPHIFPKVIPASAYGTFHPSVTAALPPSQDEPEEPTSHTLH
jgi:hypothetical protein